MPAAPRVATPGRVGQPPRSQWGRAPAPVAVSTATSVTVTGAAPKAPSVTLTGCLERSDQTYRLKDATGADAPKARSWKSGFLKKGPATIDVVDGAHSLKLADQVGHRVSLTGTLVEREIQARSLRHGASYFHARSL